MDLNKTITILGKETDPITEWYSQPILADLYFLFLFKTSTLNHNCYVSPLDVNTEAEEQNIGNSIFNDIGICIESGVNTIIIPFILTFGKNKIGHSNLLIYRYNKHVLEHYEPHGSEYMGAEKNIPKIINAKISIFRDNLFNYITNTFYEIPQPQIQIIESNIVCPILFGFQAIVQFNGNQTDKEKEYGYCAAWTLFMAYFVLRYPEISTSELFNNINTIISEINNNDPKKKGAYMTNILRRFINKLNNALFRYLNILYDEKMTFEKINNNIKQILYDIYNAIDIEKFFIVNSYIDNWNTENKIIFYTRHLQYLNLSNYEIINKVLMARKLIEKNLLKANTGVSPIIEEESLDHKELNKIDNLIRKKIKASELARAKSKLKHVSSSKRGSLKQTQKANKSIKSEELSLAKSKLKHVSSSKRSSLKQSSRGQSKKANKKIKASELALAKSKLKHVSSSKRSSLKQSSRGQSKKANNKIKSSELARAKSKLKHVSSSKKKISKSPDFYFDFDFKYN
jgi:hypothetical protein